MKRLALCVFAVSSACVEVVSLTHPRSDATVDSDAAFLCSLREQDQALASWSFTDATRCIGAGPRVRACRAVLTIPAGETVERWCTAALGRAPIEGDSSSCSVRVAPSYERTGALATGDHGFYFDGSGCLSLTDEIAGWRAGIHGRLECVVSEFVAADASTCALRAVGESCRVGASSQCLFDDAGGACDDASVTLARALSHECAAGVCLARGDGGACSCRCALAPGEDAGSDPLCACPSGFACVGALEHPSMSADLRGRYCVRVR